MTITFRTNYHTFIGRISYKVSAKINSKNLLSIYKRSILKKNSDETRRQFFETLISFNTFVHRFVNKISEQISSSTNSVTLFLNEFPFWFGSSFSITFWFPNNIKECKLCMTNMFKARSDSFVVSTVLEAHKRARIFLVLCFLNPEFYLNQSSESFICFKNQSTFNIILIEQTKLYFFWWTPQSIIL